MANLSENFRTRVRTPGDAFGGVERVGVPRFALRDLYHIILVQPWSLFFLILVVLYLSANCVFATLYTLQPNDIGEANPGAWPDAFFFSVETMATVGYGVMHPVTLYAHILVVVEIMFGVLTVPFATGMMIVKFARPTARVMFSRQAVITSFDGVPTLIFRLANIRANQILEARMKVTILRYETSSEGHRIRRLVELPLLRDTNPMFALTWSVMHRIDEASPLHGLEHADWINEELILIALMTGIDATSSALVHARYAYGPDDILPGHIFEDVISTLPNGRSRVDYRLFHETRKRAEPIAGRPPKSSEAAKISSVPAI